MAALKTPRKSLARFARFANLLILLCLFLPSAWMIATIPPLWRDADAYVQLTQDPRIAAFWGHAPAYCYLAKAPLFIGEQWERMRGLPPVHRIIESQPALTDSGIGLLIVAQHLGLGIAIFFFISTISQRFWVRLAFALIWASNALFYTFAHCIGSETLGMILVVLLATRAVRLVQSSLEPTWWAWYLFSFLLVLCLLARDLNLALIALLPLAFLISWTVKRIGRKPRTSDFRHAVIAIAVGIVCLLIAHSIPQDLARKTKLHRHSRIGYVFLWRLHFVSDLAPGSRASLMQKASESTRVEKVRSLIRLYEQMMLEQAGPIDPTTFVNRAIPIYGGPPHWEELDGGLRQMAFAFLWPPKADVMHAVKADFVAGMSLPPTVISDYLFATTAYYFEHKEEMAACANLSTFRDPANAASINAIPSHHDYFRLYQRLTYRGAGAIWLGMLLIFIWVAREKRFPLSVTAALSLALVLVGLVQFGVTCLVHDYEPRFGISMWELLLLSFLLLLGNTLDLLTEKETVRRGSLSWPKP